MAVVRFLTWNIQVYGPTKFSFGPNNFPVARTVAQTIVSWNANLVVLQEIITAVAEQIAVTIRDEVAARSGVAWERWVSPARPNGDRESYVVLWRNTNDAGANFQPVVNAGVPVEGLSPLQFPNNFSATHGRRAAYKVFQTNDTGVTFVVTDYHAPPGPNAQLGPEALARTPQLYQVTVGGAAQAVTARLLAGDWNLDVNTPAVAPNGLPWLTNPTPVPPPPAAWGQGAGTTPAVAADSLLGTVTQAVNTWGAAPATWPGPFTQVNNAIDNVFYRTAAPGVPLGTVLNMVHLLGLPGPLNLTAQGFTLSDAMGNPLFPNANMIAPLPASLGVPGYAFLLYRYAISDHLPVALTVSI